MQKVILFFSLLRKHLNNSFHCSKNIIDINIYILELKKTKKIKQNEIIEDIKCTICNISYTRQSSLNRHINSVKCNIPNSVKEIELQKQIEYLQKQIKDLH